MKKVNEVSRLAGVSKRTLQFYDDEGLLPAQRSKDNYRLYDEHTAFVLGDRDHRRRPFQVHCNESRR